MTDDAPSLPPPPPGVRTTRRRGRMSAAKVEALRSARTTWLLDRAELPDVADLRAIVAPSAPLLLDIGPGDGRATRAWARDRPDAVVVAVELHRPGLARLVSDLDAEGPRNVRVVEADATEVIEALPASTVAAVRVLFPDPWPKRRHLDRRLVDRAFVGRAATALEPGGLLHLTTDWPDYAEHMRTMVATEPRFVPEPTAGRPDRPITAYEQRGLDAGRPIADLLYRRTPAPPP